MAFPLPPKSMGPPSSCSGVQFPGTDGRSAHLDAADWLPHAVTSLRLEIGPPHRAARAVLTPPPRNLQRSRDQTARAGSLFNTSECVAAQRLQFVGKQTLGQGGTSPRPACPARARRARPRGAPSAWHAATAATAPRRTPSPLPASASGRGPGVVATSQLLQAPEAPGGILRLDFCPCGASPFLAPREAEALHAPRQNPGVGGESSLMAPRRTKEIQQGRLGGRIFHPVCRTCF
nr:uncharacterized protein LOC118968486 isoform X1 [Manis javanica]